MSQSINIIKLTLLILLGTFFMVLFGYYLIPGILLGIILRNHPAKWPVPLLALGIVLTMWFTTGKWAIRIGDMTDDPWYVLCLAGLIQWALAFVFVSAGYMMPKTFLEGYKSRKKQPA